MALIDQLSPARLSRQLRRLRDIGVIERVAEPTATISPELDEVPQQALPPDPERSHSGSDLMGFLVPRSLTSWLIRD